MNDLLKKIIDKKLTTLSGGIAFFIVINGGSILYLIMLIITKLTSINYPEFLSHLTFSKSYFIFYILSSIYSASSLFVHIINAKELIMEVKEKKYRFNRLISLILVIVFLGFVLVSGFIIVIIEEVKNTILLLFLKKILYLIIPYCLIVFINKFVSPQKNSFKKILIPSLISYIGMYLSTIGFRIYLYYFQNFKQVYGTLSFLIIFMFWIYLISISLVLGFFLIKSTN